MARGPQGEWRPDDLIACAVHVAKVATGQIEETYGAAPDAIQEAPPTPAVAGRRARAATLTAEQRRSHARGAARARWAKRTSQ